MSSRRQPQVSVPRELATARLRNWQAVRADAVTTLATMLKGARMATDRKQRQVHAVCQQPGQEPMAESTIARAEKVQALSKTGDIGLFKVAYLAYLYRLDLSSMVRRMFAPLERHAEALDEIQAHAQVLSDERMAQLVELARTLSAEQETEDAELGAGEWVETAYVWVDEMRQARQGIGGVTREEREEREHGGEHRAANHH